MFIVDKRRDGSYSLPVKELDPRDARHLSSELAIKILKLLATKELYPIQIAKMLKVHEQKVYYHIRNLEKAGIIKIVKESTHKGAQAKHYAMDRPAAVITFADLQPTQMSIKGASAYLSPFIRDGNLDALIIVGSPDPHGPDKARSRDGYYGMDLALFLGTFLNYVPEFRVKLDTEVRREDLNENNLILIGGPVVNKVTGEVNAKLPIKFVEADNWSIKSAPSSKSYPEDECGIIVKAKSPFNTEKSLLVVAGKRHVGTKAAIIAFLKHFSDIKQGNIHNNKIHAKVVEGIDLNSDGVIDDAEIRE